MWWGAGHLSPGQFTLFCYKYLYYFITIYNRLKYKQFVFHRNSIHINVNSSPRIQLKEYSYLYIVLILLFYYFYKI